MSISIRVSRVISCVVVVILLLSPLSRALIGLTSNYNRCMVLYTENVLSNSRSIWLGDLQLERTVLFLGQEAGDPSFDAWGNRLYSLEHASVWSAGPNGIPESGQNDDIKLSHCDHLVFPEHYKYINANRISRVSGLSL